MQETRLSLYKNTNKFNIENMAYRDCRPLE